MWGALSGHTLVRAGAALAISHHQDIHGAAAEDI